MKDQSNSELDRTFPTYKIITLGRFDVVKDEVSLVDLASDAKKIWELYKFMLTHRDQSFTPESLADQLWIQEQYNDPRSTLRRQMFRLRQILSESSDTSADATQTLIYKNGYYNWNPKSGFEIDADLFEALVLNAQNETENEPGKVMQDLRLALSLYKGDYLPDCQEQHWVFPVRNYYRRLYNQAAMTMIAMLDSRQAYDEIIQICQSAMKIDVYELNFHMAYMNALQQKREIKQALNHYQHITKFLYNELGIKPSDEMKAFYKELLKIHPTISGDEKSLEEAFKPIEMEDNAFYCEPDVFKSIYELERRRSQRSGIPFSVAVIEISNTQADSLGQAKQKADTFKSYLLSHLRKGDSITKWNDKQFVLLLPGLSSELMTKVLERIMSNYEDSQHIKIDLISEIKE